MQPQLIKYQCKKLHFLLFMSMTFSKGLAHCKPTQVILMMLPNWTCCQDCVGECRLYTAAQSYTFIVSFHNNLNGFPFLYCTQVIARYTDKTKQKPKRNNQRIMHHTIALLFLTLDRLMAYCLNSWIRCRELGLDYDNFFKWNFVKCGCIICNLHLISNLKNIHSSILSLF